MTCAIIIIAFNTAGRSLQDLAGAAIVAVVLSAMNWPGVRSPTPHLHLAPPGYFG
jgi:Na+/H+ antiporter NhaA